MRGNKILKVGLIIFLCLANSIFLSIWFNIIKPGEIKSLQLKNEYVLHDFCWFTLALPFELNDKEMDALQTKLILKKTFAYDWYGISVGSLPISDLFIYKEVIKETPSKSVIEKYIDVTEPLSVIHEKSRKIIVYTKDLPYKFTIVIRTRSATEKRYNKQREIDDVIFQRVYQSVQNTECADTKYQTTKRAR